MRIRTRGLLVFLTAWLLCVPGRVSAQNVSLAPDAVDLGTVSRKQGKVSAVFIIENKGEQDLVISCMRTSCPCAEVALSVDEEKSPFFGTKGSPKEWQAHIGPGQSGELLVEIDLKSEHVSPGKLLREATVISDDPEHPVLHPMVEGFVTE